jgi:hypothetical protein
MPTGTPIEQWKKDFIKEHAHDHSLAQLADLLDLSDWCVRKYCSDNRIAYIPGKPRKKRDKQIVFEKPIIQDPPKKINRPPAVYGNSPSPYGIASELHNYSSI